VRGGVQVVCAYVLIVRACACACASYTVCRRRVHRPHGPQGRAVVIVAQLSSLHSCDRCTAVTFASCHRYIAGIVVQYSCRRRTVSCHRRLHRSRIIVVGVDHPSSALL